MLVTPPCGASSNIALWRAKIKPPVELVVGDLDEFEMLLNLKFAEHENAVNYRNNMRGKLR